ncbi:MAG: hypothetical protein M1818_007169 [Claussenomyces sp. TS43310]|nr:MAG: hypothetical protein M1818_007169 [Claussenomyces sp. TS43310]
MGSRASEQLPRRPSAAEFLAPMDSSAPHPIDCSMDTRDDPTRSISPPIQEQTTRHRHFSMLRFRHASDSQLSTRARRDAAAAAAPPIPKRKPFSDILAPCVEFQFRILRLTMDLFPAPEIITTAPTADSNESLVGIKKSRIRFAGKVRPSADTSLSDVDDDEALQMATKERRKTVSESGPSGSKVQVSFDEPGRSVTHETPTSPPAYGDESASTLALPINRVSESSRSDGSGEHGVYATTTTTHTIHTTTTFFRLPGRKKPGPLFPLPPRIIPPEHGSSLAVPTASGHVSSSRTSANDPAALKGLRMPPPVEIAGFSNSLPSPSHAALARSSMSFASPGSPLMRQGSNASARSSPSKRLGLRGRSSTLSSLRDSPSEEPVPTPTMVSTRTSTSTGRKSFGDLFGLSHRLRHNSEPQNSSGPTTPASSTSKENSMQLTREPIVIPERFEDDTPARYLVRLEEAVSRGVVASVLSKGTDAFSQQVLRSYMRGFGFYGDPMDMALRKLLMEVELPKETQQIDRCLQSFANRYHECNPGIYASPDQAYFIAFSLLILHTDVFNKNNKYKMQKHDYVKNTRGEGVFDEILECFYDNISYTPFIHVEDDLDINGERIVQHKTKKKSLFPRGSADPLKRPSKEPVDPYTLIIDSKLDTLRPNLKDVMYLEEHYSYLGTATSLNMKDLCDTFFKTGVLQIISARSRPEAFMSEKTVTNPDEAGPGIVDIKITKVGLLWRKDAKKKKTRSPWQEWGAILTGAQLYFFRNTAWIKSLMHQQESHEKQGLEGMPVIFKPPLEQFQPDTLMSTDDAVALLDSTYKKHKNAFVFVRHGGFEETFLADNEDERNDWLAKLNYAAAFRTAGVRMRGLIGGNYEGQRSRGIRRLDSNAGTSSVQTPTGEVTIDRGSVDNKMAQDILAARREIMMQKIQESEEKIAVSHKQLEAQMRNARHLQILTPIQAKSREQVILAAGRMAAKMKWVRMEIWRLRCHTDILVMDLEEEDKQPNLPLKTKLIRPIPSAESEDRIGPAGSEPTTTRVYPPISPNWASLGPVTQPTPQKEIEFDLDHIFQTTPALKAASSFYKAQASWELPPLTFDARDRRHGSVPGTQPTNAALPHRTSLPSVQSIDAVTNQRAISSSHGETIDQTALEPAGFLNGDGPADVKVEDDERDDVKDPSSVAEKEKLDRGKIRRSLHRTLRDAHVPSHHRSKKGRESGSSAGDEPSGADNVLPRGTGSFVVHGKKASVITFGEELSNMSPEERMRQRKQSHRDEPNETASTSAIETDVRPALVETVEFKEHRHSTGSNATTTARSFKELHKRLSQHALTLRIKDSRGEGDGESEIAVSFSDGRRSPLSPLDDMEEDGAGDTSGYDKKQAAFYTPESATSPVFSDFSEKSAVGEQESNIGKELELDRSPSQRIIAR